MRSRKIIFLAATLALLTFSASAEFDQSSYDVTYGDSFDLTVEYDEYEGDVVAMNINICGDVAAQRGDGQSIVDFPADFSIELPNDASCGQGVQMMGASGVTYNGDTVDLGSAEVDVQARDMQAHKGDYLYIKMNPGTDPVNLKAFFLSNDVWDHGDATQGGLLVEGIKNEIWGKTRHRCSYYPENELGERAIGTWYANLDPRSGGAWDWQRIDENPGDCGNRAGMVLDQEFGPAKSRSMHLPYLNYGVTAETPVHENGDYHVDGQLARAYEPKIDGYSGLNGQGPKWFICREGATGVSGDGKVVSLSSDEGGKLLKCDLEGDEEGWRDDTQYNWEPVTECQDGLDNNNNGKIDTADTACNNNPGTEVEGDIECEAMVGTPETGGSKGAFYDSSGDAFSPESSSCTYGNLDQNLDYTNQPAEVFFCTVAGGISGYDGPTNTSAQVYCNNVATGGLPAGMPVVQYFVPKQAMPDGSTRWAKPETEYREGGFAPNFRFQRLHEAEIEYGSSGPHDPAVWETHNIDTQPYEDYTDNHGQFLDSWDVANASGRFNEDIKYPTRGTLDQDNVFKGGFHGDCSPAMNWTYSGGQWRCDVGSAGRATITINSYRLGGDLGGKLAGFQVNWSEMQKWQIGHPASPPEGSDDGWVNNVEVKAMCWQGAQSERPQDLSKVVNLSASVQEGQTTYVVGELPDRGSVSNPEQYTCVFGFSQQVYPLKHTISAATDLFYQGNEGPCISCRYTYGYITEGTNDPGKGMIRISDQRIRPSDHTSAENMQQWLDGKQASETSGELWKHFVTTDDETENRNPWKACVNSEECGVAGE